MGVIIPVGWATVKFRWKPLNAPDEMITSLAYAHDLLKTPQEEADEWLALGLISGQLLNPAKYSTRYQSVGVEVTVMTATGPIPAEAIQRTTGTGTGSPLTPNTSILVRKTTNRGGRMGRGRMFLPGIFISEIDVDELGIIAPTDLTGLGLLFNAFHDNIIADGKISYLLHSDGSTPDEIVSFKVEPIVATQRRRLRR